MLNKMYYLVANPEDRFSRDVAHFQMVYQFIAVHQSNTIKTSLAQRKSSSKEMNDRETNENMHSNSTRANFVNRIPCFMRKYPRKKTKGKTYK